MTTFFTYTILGILQGIFEWIPISSEGVVALAAQYLGAGVNPVDIALFLHLGTLFAALVYYGRDWINLLLFRDINLLRFLIIATAISLPIGFVVYKTVVQAALGAGLLAVTGVGLLFTAYFQKKKVSLKLSKTAIAAIAGVLQGLAAIPGFSRSGSTIFGLSLGDFEPKAILRLSYMMSVPAVATSSGYLFLKNPAISTDAWPAIVASFAAGLLFLEILTRFSGKTNFYRFALAFAVLCLAGAVIEILM